MLQLACAVLLCCNGSATLAVILDKEEGFSTCDCPAADDFVPCSATACL